MDIFLNLYRYNFNSFLKSKIISFRQLSTFKSAILKQVDQNKTIINKETITKLEQLSLIGYDNERGITVLEAAVNFSERLRNIYIPEEVEPLYTPLENCNLYLREDNVQKINNREEILKNAAVLEEEYFVVPLQNSKTKS